MKNNFSLEQWGYERRKDGHYFTNDKGYFVIPLDLNNYPKESDEYCYFSFFLKEEYKDVDQDEVEEYVKWFFHFITNGKHRRSYLTYDYKYWSTRENLVKKEGYVSYNFGMLREDMLEVLSDDSTVVETYFENMIPGETFLFPKNMILDNLDLRHLEFRDFCKEITIYIQLRYKNLDLFLARELVDKKHKYTLFNIKIIENRDKDNSVVLSELLSLIFQEDESNLTSEVMDTFEKDTYGFKGLIRDLFKEKELSTDLIERLEEEIGIAIANMDVTLRRIENERGEY